MPRGRRQHRGHGALLLCALLLSDLLQERLRGPHRHAVHARLGPPRRTPQEQDGRPKTTGSESVATYHGPSFMIDDLVYHYDTGDARSVLINCHYPVSADRFVLQYGIIVKRSPAQKREEADELAANMAGFIKLGFEQDIAIWKNKARIDNPLLCEEDGPVYQLRRWYEQFYVDAAGYARR
ncbi:hypothetical protein NKH18_45795 [Streptomyces sp. M10(2022)]